MSSNKQATSIATRTKAALAVVFGLVVAGVAGFVSVPASAMAFVVEFALGGTAPVSLSAVAAAMGGVHLLIGIGEGVITGLVVAAVLASRPDIVFGVRDTPLAKPVARPEVAAV